MPSEIMWSIKDIAERDNVSKAAVSKAVKSMLAAKPETPVVRDSRDRVTAISLADYDHFRGRNVNPAKARAELRKDIAQDTIPLPVTDSFEEARRQNEWMKVRRQQLAHDEDVGNLIRRDKLNEAHARIGREIQTLVARLQNKADDLALAVSKEGVHGARVKLREIAFDLGNEIADKLAEIAAAAPVTDRVTEDDIQ